MRVRSFTDPPEALLDHAIWKVRSPRGEVRTLKVMESAAEARGLRVRLEGIADRNGAEALRGWEVQVARADMPPLAAGEHYRDDLLGFAVENREGQRLGEVAYFVDLPVGAVMVVKGDGAREHWVPAVAKHVLRIDVAAKRISVDWPAELT